MSFKASLTVGTALVCFHFFLKRTLNTRKEMSCLITNTKEKERTKRIDSHGCRVHTLCRLIALIMFSACASVSFKFFFRHTTEPWARQKLFARYHRLLSGRKLKLKRLKPPRESSSSVFETVRDSFLSSSARGFTYSCLNNDNLFFREP